MSLLDVYPRFDIELESGEGCWLTDEKGQRYLDMYGGHAVISIGHSHTRYIDRITKQLNQLGFYSNSVQLPIQTEYANKLIKVSGCSDYGLFMCNSGAEANENALKLASFVTGRRKILSFDGAFHGRTSLAVDATDNDNITAPVNFSGNIIRTPFNHIDALWENMNHEVAAVIVEGIQGISGINVPYTDFMNEIRKVCDHFGSLMIVDEVQSGFGRSGEFFAFQYHDIHPDIISMGKGMGNGFPVGGILVANKHKVHSGMLGSTFGGNPLACAAGLAVLEVIDSKKLTSNAKELGSRLMEELSELEMVTDVRGQGLMIGIDFEIEASVIRNALLKKHHIFTGSATNKNTLRLLPPLNIGIEQIDLFLNSLTQVVANEKISIN